jgi:hypothetical protein
MITTGLWERSPCLDAREQVTLFNIVTATTVGIGAVLLYVALFIVMLAALESHETVREAAYTYQPDTRLAAASPEQAPNL